MKILDEFRDFLKEYKIVGLAVAFIVGAAATDLVKAFVNEILMPSITPFIPHGGWQTAKLILGPVALGWGAFLGALINFLIMAGVVFLILKLVSGKKKDNKK